MDRGVLVQTFLEPRRAQSHSPRHHGPACHRPDACLYVTSIDRSQRWGEYDCEWERSATVDASVSNRTIVVVHSGLDGEEVFFRAEE